MADVIKRTYGKYKNNVINTILLFFLYLFPFSRCIEVAPGTDDYAFEVKSSLGFFFWSRIQRVLIIIWGVIQTGRIYMGSMFIGTGISRSGSSNKACIHKFWKTGRPFHEEYVICVRLHFTSLIVWADLLYLEDQNWTTHARCGLTIELNGVGTVSWVLWSMFPLCHTFSQLFLKSEPVFVTFNSLSIQSTIPCLQPTVSIL